MTAARGLPGPAWLFCPADRPDRYQKALAAADLVILDLEDAVAAHRRPAARDALVANPLDPERVVVRINPAESVDHEPDLAAIRASGYRTLMLAKTEHPAQPRQLGDWDVIALCETQRGVVNATEIAAEDNVVALMWGAEDLIAATGGLSSRNASGGYRQIAEHARVTVLLAAAAAGRPAVDAVYLDYADTDGLRAETVESLASGFRYKACIHPVQVDIVRRAFEPSQVDIDRAHRVLDAAQHGGVLSVDGKMVDAPLIKQAEATLALARSVPQAHVRSESS